MRLPRTVAGALAAAGAAAGAGLAVVEARYRRQPGNAARCREQDWAATRPAPDHLRIGGRIIVANGSARRELMLCDVRPRVHLLSSGEVGELEVRVGVRSGEPAYPPRPDGYWTAYVVRPARYGRDTHVDVVVDVRGPATVLDGVYAARVSVHVDTYGFAGPGAHVHHVVVSIGAAGSDTSSDWRTAEGGVAVRPLRTHLLGPGDDPVEVVGRYAVPQARPGDVVVLGESPLAVVQGRFVDPANRRPGWVASRLAQFMSGEGSVGTGPGLQAVVDEVGVARVVAALGGGVAGKLVGRDGWFYRLAGRPSSLVDDVTGTLPPYDGLIVLGPRRAGELCRRIRAVTGLEAAVVDANDLGAVDVLAASDGVDHDLVRRALRSNPAGNAAETTPLVLIRPGPRPGEQAGPSE